MGTQTVQTQEALQAVAALSAQVLRMAGVVNTKMASAPRAVDPAQIKAAADALVDNGWAPEMDKEAVAKLLSDPTVAITTLTNLAVKAAVEVNGDPRLAAGRATSTKFAADPSPFGTGVESEADRAYAARLKSYVRN